MVEPGYVQVPGWGYHAYTAAYLGGGAGCILLIGTADKKMLALRQSI
jgi:hypothetical protein